MTPVLTPILTPIFEQKKISIKNMETKNIYILLTKKDINIYKKGKQNACQMERETGLEPATFALGRQRSTIEPLSQKILAIKHSKTELQCKFALEKFVKISKNQP